MKKVAIIYGSDTGNTKEAAQLIAAQLQEFSPVVKDISGCSAEDFTAAGHLFLGTSTWGFGDLQDDWADFLPRLKSVDLTGKTISLFGLGDSVSYPDTFVDGMGELYAFFSGKGCEITGTVPLSGYNFEASRAVKNGEFVGLPLDADSEGHLTEERIKNWLDLIKPLLQERV